MKKAVAEEATIGDRFQVVVPKAIREELGLTKRMKVRVTVQDGKAVLEPKRDMSSFDAAMKKWAGTGKRNMARDGFKTVEDYMNWIRPRE